MIHLHNHTKNSKLDGAITSNLLFDHLKSLNMNAFAKTDHGTLAGSLDFVKEGTKTGIKIIVGVELYEVNDINEKYIGEFGDCRNPDCTDPTHNHKDDKDQKLPDEAEQKTKYWHLTCLAKNKAGYQKLVQAVSLANRQEAFFHKPRADRKVFEEILKGDDIIIGTGCPLSRMSKTARAVDEIAALEKEFNWYRSIFGDNNIFVEIMANSFAPQREINEKMINFADRKGLPIVITNDCHYLTREHARLQDILLCITTGQQVDDTNRKFKFEGDPYYVRSEDELREAFLKMMGTPIREEWLTNSNLFADRCEHGDYIKDKEFRLPQFDIKKQDNIPQFKEWVQRNRRRLSEQLHIPLELIEQVGNL